MQSAECLKALGDVNIHVALIGSSFADNGMFTVCTVPCKCKLTVSTRNSILDARSYRGSSIEVRGSSIEFRDTRRIFRGSR